MCAPLPPSPGYATDCHVIINRPTIINLLPMPTKLWE